MKCEIIINDESSCNLIGLSDDHIEYFSEKFTIFAANYRFHPKYKLGVWDGKIRYFSKYGKTYVNLLNDIIPDLIELKYKVSLTDNRPLYDIKSKNIDEHFFNHILTSEGKPWIMREYQVEFVNSLINNGGGIGIAGTGAGKTSMTAALAKVYELSNNYKSVIIVPDKNLTVQTTQEYAFFGLDVGEYSGTTKQTNCQHLVSTWQALNNNPAVIYDRDVVIVDECHTLKGPALLKLLIEHGKNIPLRFGVTGTLPKEESDKMAVRLAVGDVQYEIPAHVLISEGWLSNLDIHIYQLNSSLQKEYDEYVKNMKLDKPIQYSKFKRDFFIDWNSEKAHMNADEVRLRWIVDFITKIRMTGNTICLVNTIPIGKKIQKLIEGSLFLSASSKKETRTEYFEKFDNNDDVVLIATAQLLSTGVNIPRIFNVIYIDIGRSFIKTIQTIGRGLRKAHDKDHVMIYDICSDFRISKSHLNQRIKYYQESKYNYKKFTIDL